LVISLASRGGDAASNAGSPGGTAEKLIQEFNTLVALRHNWDSLWQDVHDIAWPDSGDFTTTRSPGERRTFRVYDPTNVMAIEKGASILESLLTPRTQQWHGLNPSLPELAEDHDAKEYFEELTRILFAMRNRPGSGFYDQKHEGYNPHRGRMDCS
jgi:hypothetical protein